MTIIACGNFILSFPEESRNSIDELFKLWTAHLVDSKKTFSFLFFNYSILFIFYPQRYCFC